jgi:hypothetical protein
MSSSSNLGDRGLSSQSFIANFVTHHSILYCRMNSTVGQNILGCCQRYNTCIDSILDCGFNVNNTDCFAGSISDDARNAVAIISELIDCRDGISSLSNSLFDKDYNEQLIYLLYARLSDTTAHLIICIYNFLCLSCLRVN